MSFEIMCAGGCGEEPQYILLLIRNIIHLCRIIIPFIIFIIGIIKIIKYRKGTKNKERRKKGIILVVVSVVIFLLLTLVEVGYGSLILNRVYDETMHCWCA